MFISQNPLQEDDQVMVEQVKQSAYEDDEGMKIAKTDYNSNN